MMNNFFKSLLCGLLIVAAACGGLWLVLDQVGISDVAGITTKVPNPDNLIDPAEYSFKSGSVVNGVTITYDENGLLTLDGQATEDFEICLGEYYVLDKSFYTMSVYCPEPARTTTGTKITTVPASAYAESIVIAKGSFADCYTFENTKLQHVRVYITVTAGDNFDAYTVAPVLVAGKTIGTFYINQEINL